MAATYNLFDYLAGGMKVNEPLVDSELECVPSLGSLTTRLKNPNWLVNGTLNNDFSCTDTLTRGDFQSSSRQTNWALDTELLVLRSVNQVVADFIPGGSVRRSSNNIRIK